MKKKEERRKEISCYLKVELPGDTVPGRQIKANVVDVTEPLLILYGTLGF
jgi:hypothetical protein